MEIDCDFVLKHLHYFDDEIAQKWSDEFNVDLSLVVKGIAACRIANVSLNYYRKKFLEKQPIEINKDVNKAYMDLLKEQRFQSWEKNRAQ